MPSIVLTWRFTTWRRLPAIVFKRDSSKRGTFVIMRARRLGTKLCLSESASKSRDSVAIWDERVQCEQSIIRSCSFSKCLRTKTVLGRRKAGADNVLDICVTFARKRAWKYKPNPSEATGPVGRFKWISNWRQIVKECIGIPLSHEAKVLTELLQDEITDISRDQCERFDVSSEDLLLRVSSDDVGRQDTVEVELDNFIQHFHRKSRFRYCRINNRYLKALRVGQRSIQRHRTSFYEAFPTNESQIYSRTFDEFVKIEASRHNLGTRGKWEFERTIERRSPGQWLLVASNDSVHVVGLNGPVGLNRVHQWSSMIYIHNILKLNSTFDPDTCDVGQKDTTFQKKMKCICLD